MKQIPILMYHSIDEPVTTAFKKWVVRPSTFDGHMRYLHEAGYKALTVSELATRFHNSEASLPDKPIVITFDDGFADFYTFALPILRQYQLTASLYIVTGYIGQTSQWLSALGEGERPMLTWEQIIKVHASGIECAPHTHTHPLLDVLDYTSVYDEISRSKALLEDCLKIPSTTFAYPGGMYTAKTQKIVLDLGFTAACAVKRNMTTLNTNRFALARLPVFDINVDKLRDILDGKEKLWPPYERLRDRGFRLIRQTRQLFNL